MADETITDYDDVTEYGLDDDLRDEILRKQIECTFIWGPKTGWAVGVLMTYIWKDGSFWVSATSQRKRIAAIKRDPRVSIVVSSHGTDLGPAKGITAKGRAVIHDDQETKDWFYPALAKAIRGDDLEGAKVFEKFLDSPRRVILEVEPTQRIGYDGQKMGKATAEWMRAQKGAAS